MIKELTFVHYHTHTLAAPSAPTIVSVEATSPTSISVQWNASKKDGGSPITGYVVEYRPTPDPLFKTASNPSFETQVVARDVFSTTLDGLTPSTFYSVRVMGENAVGRSVPSRTWNVVTDSELIEKSFFPGAYTDSKTLQATGEIVVCSKMIVVNKASLFLT